MARNLLRLVSQALEQRGVERIVGGFGCMNVTCFVSVHVCVIISAKSYCCKMPHAKHAVATCTGISLTLSQALQSMSLP